jgi:OH-DDVA oxygenase/3-O-methylgallate 3,4-dioxygenase
MAEIVLGFATSHGPLLATPPGEWDLRGAVDRRNTELAWRDRTYDFAALAQARGSDFAAMNAPDVRAERYARCQRSLDELGRVCDAARPDALLIVGDDHHEWFMADIQPAFSIFHGDRLLNRALTPEETARQQSLGLGYAAEMYYPAVDESYACPAGLATHLVESAMGDGFDVTSCGQQPADAGAPRRLGHSFGFIYRRILRTRPPLIPVMVNTYYPPNQPSPRRCFEFGKALGRALVKWPGGERIAVAASGGLTHFVVDEEMDRRLLDAMASGDYDRLVSEPDIHFRSGTSEIKNWIVVAGILAETGLRMTLLDYAACYRTEAGTGSGMGFAIWT